MSFFASCIFAFLSLCCPEKPIEPPIVTHHILELEEGPLSYTATIGAFPAMDHLGLEQKGHIGYIYYTADNPSPNRPITFAFNGGPGSSSIWLHAGVFGPYRISSLEEDAHCLVPNSETLLQESDLVFIDPIGTGFSRATSAENAKTYYDTSADIESIAAFIYDFLTWHNRWSSPCYIAGESYGTLRACGLAHFLQSRYGLFPAGLLLISCAIDYQTFLFHADNFLPPFLYLPTYTATAWYYGRYRPEASLKEVVAEAKAFSYGSYAPALLQPGSAAEEPLYEQLASLTGLPLDIIKRERGRICDDVFFSAFFPGEKKALGRYDTRLSGDCLWGISYVDPSRASALKAFAAPFQDYLYKTLHCPPSHYTIFSREINRQWDYRIAEFGYPNYMEELRKTLLNNPTMKIFVGSGYFDAATPFAATEYCFNHLNLPDFYRKNLRMEIYEGGHMFYLNPTARKQFKQDLTQFYKD